MLESKKIYQSINNVLNCGLVGTFLPLSLTFFGVRKVFRIIMEEKIKDLNKKDLFNYLIENRIFLESLTYNDVKRYIKIFNSIRNRLFLEKIKQFFVNLKNVSFTRIIRK